MRSKVAAMPPEPPMCAVGVQYVVRTEGRAYSRGTVERIRVPVPQWECKKLTYVTVSILLRALSACGDRERSSIPYRCERCKG